MIKDRVTQRAKEANNFAWYKERIDQLIRSSSTGIVGMPEGVDDKARMLANYKLFNDQIDINDFKHIIKPYGDQDDEVPVDFRNRDIISGKIQAIHGIEMKRPLSHKIVAVNDEATNRREQETFKRIQQFVISSIMKPIEKEIRLQKAQEMKGQALTKEEQMAIEEEVQTELKAQTPEEVLLYMKRDHQDPAEALMTQLFNFDTKRLSLQDKFNKGFFHSTISAVEVFWLGINHNSTVLEPLNPVRFNFGKAPDTEFIEDGEWASYEWRMSPSQIISFFGNELSNSEIDKIYSLADNIANGSKLSFENFFDENYDSNSTYISVFHCAWKSLKKIGFLTYEENGVENKTIVDENYTLQEGDKKIEWEWVPEVHEGYRIGQDMYKRMRPLPGQYRDLGNLYDVKLPYYGIVLNSINSSPVSLVDRMKPWQYYYNIILYRVEMLMASDRGKILLMNMDLIPEKEGFDMNKWLHFFENMKIGWVKGDKNQNIDVSTAAKHLDMSLVSDINQYIQLAEFIEAKSGSIVGITKEIEGQIATSALVGNTQSNIDMASNIIQPYFAAHDKVKKNVLTALLELSKLAYSSEEGKEKVVYVLDDMSLEMLNIDSMLLDSSTFGIFISDANEGFETKQSIQQLFQAALQNDKAELSDLIRIMKASSLQETEEILLVAEEKGQKRAMELESIKSDNQLKVLEAQEKAAEKQHERDKELLLIKIDGELQKQAMLSVGFNEDKDLDSDGTPDVMEIYQNGQETELNAKKLKLEEKKVALAEEKQKNDLKLAEKKLAIDRIKAKKSPSKKG